MKPKNLKFPFSWDERRPVIHEGVLIIPQNYSQHESWLIPENFYPKNQKVCVEYCSGNGDWVIERAKKNPNQFWIAVEKKFQRVRKIWSKMCNHQIQNLRIVCGEAQIFTRWYLLQEFVDQIFVNFPDPWPKMRHAKHRLVQPSFVDMLAYKMKKNGVATFVTDDSAYNAQIVDIMLSNSQWKAIFPEPYFVNDWKDYGNSWFENLLRKEGRNFFYTCFKKWN